MTILHGFFGLFALLLMAWLLSEDRWAPPWRIVLGGVGLQIGLALLFVKFEPAAKAFLLVNDAVGALQKATDAGTSLVFGYLGGAPLPFAETQPGASYILGFRAFPLVLVISALASLLLYWGILQRIVGIFAWGLQRTLGVGGALGLGAAVHIFVGMIEAPLLVRPYLLKMSRGELFALMSCGMAGIAGTVMVIYASLLGGVIPRALSHILIASVISTPAALAVAALMIPFRPEPEDNAKLSVEDPPASVMDAIARGTKDGIGFLAGILAMLIVLVALVTLVNMGLAMLPHWGAAPITLQRLFAFVFQPLMWLIGIPPQETATAAKLMGTKTAINEFVAYIDLAHLPATALGPRARLIMTYALCGFANFGSVGIMIGGMTAMAPERRQEIVTLALRSLVSGTLATLMSGTVIGMLV
ncbi:NupC/NupG family nucleoside CNT transporter [Methylovirgula sp. HY1]|uniref:NupC/NupG family nucleoside CNT transporter n=1 Tax=Methylovirgula sp. HY1 TaxID=2822761 RepID=UPI001C5A9930|nr:nucleoside transporter C-terminal domain-containing protein [Methylovirgula sp. HY1]QXX73642.1 Putative nucleoside permease NupX [Methylovirgula sp. HY1]